MRLLIAIAVNLLCQLLFLFCLARDISLRVAIRISATCLFVGGGAAFARGAFAGHGASAILYGISIVLFAFILVGLGHPVDLVDRRALGRAISELAPARRLTQDAVRIRQAIFIVVVVIGLAAFAQFTGNVT